MNYRNNHKYILFTDIDGTLLDQSRSISLKNFLALQNARNIIRVAISGRNLASARRVLPPDLPIDYLIFSNGAGILDWHTDKIIFSQNLPMHAARNIARTLINHGITFTVHQPIPNTHYYLYHIGNYYPKDLTMRNNYYKDYVSPLSSIDQISDATCIICMLTDQETLFNRLVHILQKHKDKISITRTTSPFTHTNIWLEIYHKDINKGNTAKRLCEILDIDTKNTIGIGNDYNDLSLLEFVNFPFVVDNAPQDLKKLFPKTAHHNNHAIAEVIDSLNHLLN